VKLPAFLAGAGKGLRVITGRVAHLAGSVREVSTQVAERIGAGAGDLLENRAARLGLAVGGGVIVLIVAIILGTMAAGALRPDTPSVPEAAAAGKTAPVQSPSLSSGSIPQVPRSGPELASMLLIPDQGEWPYPLALEPKSRYTEDDAAPLRPDLAEVDVSGLIRRRKAELETMYGSVD
jgi:hypothetical protein